MKQGFTLIELLVFVAIFSLVVVSFIAILVTMLQLQLGQSAAAAVSEESGYLLEQIQYYVNSAQLVNMVQDVATNTITLVESSSTINPTMMTASSGVMYIKQGLGFWDAMTSNAVTVSNFSATRHFNFNSTSSPFGTDSISYSFMISATSTAGKAYTESFQSSASTFIAVPKIVLLQQDQGGTGLSNVGSVSAVYSSGNQSGNLLVAVVGNTFTSNVAVTDSAGDAWSLVASATYPLYNQQLTVFDVVNVPANSSNTVTATFTSASTTNPSILIYEYRGASTSSPLDASSSQSQASNANPSSGLANATSGVELIFGVAANPDTTDIPLAGFGFALETTSTVANLFVEDMDQYVSSPVYADWQYAVSPDTLDLVLTFK